MGTKDSMVKGTKTAPVASIRSATGKECSKDEIGFERVGWIQPTLAGAAFKKDHLSKPAVTIWAVLPPKR